MSESDIEREDKERFGIIRRQPNAETLEALEQVNSRRELFGPYRTIEDLREALSACR